MSSLESDISALYGALKRIEREAEKLRWADKRPWKRKTHVWVESEIIVVDFHDLNTKLMKEAFEASVRVAKSFQSGAISFISGIGKHSAGNYSKNREILIKKLDKLVQNKSSWQWHSHGMGRFVLITDLEKAPPTATGKLSSTMKMAIIGFVVLLIISVLHSMWPK